MSEEDDNKRTERWQADADGILVFVSPDSFSRIDPIHSPTIDWSIFSYRCGICCSFEPGPHTEPTRYSSFLSREHLQAARRGKWVPSFRSFHTVQSGVIVHPANIRRLGHFLLVLESAHQSYVRHTRDIAETMGSSIH